MSVDDDLDALYGVPPEKFTALRKELAAAAKKRGDGDAARLIAAARRPTVAAWVLNQLVRADGSVRSRLADLTSALRAAHADMDGPRIRELTGVQRTLIAELVRASFVIAELSNSSAAFREDITATLQAAIADPEVAGRLGRLEKAEQFSGFGDFGAVAAAPVKPKPTKDAPAKAEVEPKAPAGEVRAARHRRDAAAKADASARKASAEAADALTAAKATAATALRRYQKILATLGVAEREMNSATAEVESAQRAATTAASSADEAAAELAEAERSLARLAD